MADRQQNRNQNQNQDWAQQVPEDRFRGIYDDYGWEPGESVLPEFRKPDVRLNRREVQRLRLERLRQKLNPEAPEYRMQGGTPIRQGEFTGMGPKNYQRSDDRIFEDICDRLLMHGQIDARDVVVDVKDGEVTLRGIVDTRSQKHMAERTAEDVYGVIQVNNDLKVRQDLARRG